MQYRPVAAATVTTAGIIRADNIENISFQMNLAGHTSGNGVLTVLGSNDGVTYTALAFVDPTVANTDAQTITRVVSKTISSNGAVVGCLENFFRFSYLKFNVAVTTDGTYDVFVTGDPILRT